MDGNMAALRALHAAEDRAEKNHRTFEPGIVEELIDDFMSGRPITKLRGIKVDLAYIFDGEEIIGNDEAAKLIYCGMDERIGLFSDIEERMRERVKNWIESSDLAASIIEDRVREAAQETEEV